jgi:hypothetical protein
MSAIKNISLFVPHVYSNFTSAKVMEVFNGLHIGEVKSVDLVSKMGSDSKHYNAVYVHFTTWYDTKVARDFQERLLDPTKEVKVMYDHPWYWIVLENKGKKHLPGDRKPTIDIGNNDIKPVTSAHKPRIDLLDQNKNKRTHDAPVKPKSWVKVPAQVKLEAKNNGFTKEEIDFLEEQAELDEKRANNGFTQEEIELLTKEVELDKCYDIMPILSLTEHNKALKYEIEALYSQLAVTLTERNSFEERYIKETSKNETLMEIIKDVHNKK